MILTQKSTVKDENIFTAAIIKINSATILTTVTTNMTYLELME